MVLEADDFLLEIVNSAIEVVRAVIQHAHPLIAAGLVIKDNNDQVSVHIFSLICEVFQDLFCSFQSLQCLLSVLILEQLNALLVNLVDLRGQLVGAIKTDVIVVVDLLVLEVFDEALVFLLPGL